jgi:hypothetical protein
LSYDTKVFFVYTYRALKISETSASNWRLRHIAERPVVVVVAVDNIAVGVDDGLVLQVGILGAELVVADDVVAVDKVRLVLHVIVLVVLGTAK